MLKIKAKLVNIFTTSNVGIALKRRKNYVNWKYRKEHFILLCCYWQDFITYNRIQQDLS